MSIPWGYIHKYHEERFGFISSPGSYSIISSHLWHLSCQHQGECRIHPNTFFKCLIWLHLDCAQCRYLRVWVSSLSHLKPSLSLLSLSSEGLHGRTYGLGPPNKVNLSHPFNSSQRLLTRMRSQYEHLVFVSSLNGSGSHFSKGIFRLEDMSPDFIHHSGAKTNHCKANSYCLP